MLSTTIHQARQGKFEPVGTIAAVDGKLVCDPPDGPLLVSICEDAIVGEGGEMIEPTDAEAFVRNLYLQYKSVYLMATQAEESK